MQSIDTLNTLPRAAFLEELRVLFEAAPSLADTLYAARPFASYPRLIDTAESLTRSMPFDAQVAVLSAHPRIGADPASMSRTSFEEQGYSAEDSAELASTNSQLAELNAAYEQRFGFRFVVFVNGQSRAAIVEVLRQRLLNDPNTELESGLRDMFLIARARLASARIGSTFVRDDDPAHQAVLEELRRLAMETYGEERAAETLLQSMLQSAATAVWRVTQEPLEPAGNEP